MRRYFPGANLKNMVEQYWIVDWQLQSQQTHIQQNLPDPNFHFTIEQNKAGQYDKCSVIGPVSKSYQYTMSGKGGIIGVKFALGALSKWLADKPSVYVDKVIPPNTVFQDLSLKQLKMQLNQCKTDEAIFQTLEENFAPFVTAPSKQQLTLQKLVACIKETASITTVGQLIIISGISERTIQRCFAAQLGLSAKWLIRKYRLQQAIELLDNSHRSILDIAASLGYTDQSHFIKDCKAIVGQTPADYINNQRKEVS